MARSLNPVDAHAIMNLLVKEATGQNAQIQAVDASSFVSAGEAVMQTGTENVMNALSRVLGRTFMAVRPYNAKLRTINAINTDMFTDRMRKISFYSKDAQASGWFNTDLYTQHASGLDNGVNNVSGTTVAMNGLGNMWQQNQGIPLELNFHGQDVWDDSITVYENQLKIAFRGEAEFSEFMAGIMTEKGNDIESQKEAFNRMTILSMIAGVIDLNQGGSVVNLTSGFNTKFGTNYTSAQLRTTYLKEFLAYFVSVVKTLSSRMSMRTKNYHWSPTKTIGGQSYSLLRHTPRDRQKALIYQPLLNDAEAQVFSQIFNPQFLDVDQFEGVDYWQNINDPSAIDVYPAIPNLANPSAGQIKGNRVQYDYIVGCIYDTDAMMVDYQMDSSYTTGVEARKGYRNIWWHFSKNAITDFTENFIVFVMGNDA